MDKNKKAIFRFQSVLRAYWAILEAGGVADLEPEFMELEMISAASKVVDAALEGLYNLATPAQILEFDKMIPEVDEKLKAIDEFKGRKIRGETERSKFRIMKMKEAQSAIVSALGEAHKRKEKPIHSILCTAELTLEVANYHLQKMAKAKHQHQVSATQ